MKSMLTALVAVCICICCEAQVGRIETSNPAPRVGDRITIAFSLTKSAAKLTGHSAAPLAMSSMGEGTIEMTELVLTDTGMVTLGPIQMNIGGLMCTTNAVSVHVAPRLPDDVLRGVWIRTLSFQGEDYIIIEQRHPGELKPSSGSSGVTTFSMSTEDVKWAKLNLDKMQRKGINAQLKDSKASVQATPNGDALYMITVYTWKATAEAKRQLKIEKNLLTDAPDKGAFVVEAAR